MSKIKKTLLGASVIFCFWALLTVLPPLFYKPESNATPLPNHYKKGVYHLHSQYSDGKGTIAEIIAAGASLGLDFIILTDHGAPNVKGADATTYTDGILLMGGSEFSLVCGHLAVTGFKKHDYIFPPEPQEAIDEVLRDGGVCFLSHPFDDRIPWEDWEIEAFTGLEVMSSYSAARQISAAKLAAFPLQYATDSNYALTNTLSYPSVNIKKWDEFNTLGLREKKGYFYYGIYALDAHAKLPVTENFSLDFPTYKAMFQILTVYVNVGVNWKGKAENDTKSVVDALRRGNFFNAVESIAPANGFEAFIKTPNGERVDMGQPCESTSGILTIQMPFEFETDIRIKQNGNIIKTFSANKKKKIEVGLREKGFYYIEVFVTGNTFHNIPWILTNPFFLGYEPDFLHLEPSTIRKQRRITENLKEQKLFPLKQGFFQFEKNPGSSGSVSIETVDDGETVTGMTFMLNKDAGKISEMAVAKDFWCAIGARRKFDFSSYKGVCFDARTDRARRYWVEFRTGKESEGTWYRHSFLPSNEWKRHFIPFEAFNVIFGNAQIRNLIDVRSFFFSINNANAYSSISGELRIKNVGLYR